MWWLLVIKKFRDYLLDLFNCENLNILKFFEIIEFEIKDLIDLLNKVVNWWLIDEVWGKGLDELGVNVG